MSELHVGAEAWVFDGNRRVYAQDKNGRRTGPPIYREHFRKVYIVGENRRSWIYGYSSDSPNYTAKAVKRPSMGRCLLYTEQQVEDACWLNEKRQRLLDSLRRCEDIEVWRQIDKILNTPEHGEAE